MHTTCGRRCVPPSLSPPRDDPNDHHEHHNGEQSFHGRPCCPRSASNADQTGSTTPCRLRRLAATRVSPLGDAPFSALSSGSEVTASSSASSSGGPGSGVPAAVRTRRGRNPCRSLALQRRRAGHPHHRQPRRPVWAVPAPIVAMLLNRTSAPNAVSQATTSTRATSARASSTSVRPNAAGSSCSGDCRPSHSSMSWWSSWLGSASTSSSWA